MLRVALIALVHRIAGTTVNLSQLYFVDPANDTAAAEEAEPTSLPCFGSSPGDTPSSPCPEPGSRNLRGRR